jgi:uncharacterized membrane protein
MKEHPFSIGEAFQEGWRLTKNNIAFLLVYQLIVFILMAITGGTHDKWEWSLWHLMGWLIVVVTKMGLYHSALLIAAGQKPGFDELYKNWRMLYSWVVASFFFGVVFVIGLILFIVPGLYLWARYGFYPFFILDKESGPLEALNQSAEATEGMRWPVLLLFLACLGLNLVGILLVGIGLLITVPVTLLALAIVYRKINASSQEAIQPSEIISNH